MKTREASYKDYGFKDNKEAKKLMKFCRGPDFEFRKELIESAEKANKSIADDIYYSIMKNLSYDDISVKTIIHYSKVDFYAYRRKCLYYFRKALKEMGKWK